MLEQNPALAATIGLDIDASPTPYHAIEHAVSLLREAGFTRWQADSSAVGRWFHADGGALAAWVVADHHTPRSPLRIVGAHTDSPNLRVKPQPDRVGAGRAAQLGVEVYGGALLNSWLDRDLGLAGRVSVIGDSGPELRLFRDDRPLARIPQLAIHLDREINTSGLKLNPQQHLSPIWAVGEAPTFAAYLAEQVGGSAADVLAWDAMFHDLTPSRLSGLDEALFVASRIDNLLSSFVAARTLIDVAADPGSAVPMISLFDHEEVGSVSATGAASPFLVRQVARVHRSLAGDDAAVEASLAGSLVVSADGAHATHPNFADRHEPDHQIALNGGPVLKVNANQRYATDATTAGVFIAACRAAEVPFQRFVTRTDLACGSTIGPATAGALGVPVVDAGVAQLAMHSARETAGAHDPARFGAVLGVLLRG